jgi:exonuclease III
MSTMETRTGEAAGAPFRLVAYNFLAGGSAKRPGQWSRVLGALRPDVVFGQECRPPHACPGERFRPTADDAFAWRPARMGRWGTGLLVRGARLVPIAVPQFDGWVTGGEVQGPRWSTRALRVFSVHGPAGERGYVKTMHEILDRIARLSADADVVLGGDFNVAVGYRDAKDPRTLGRREVELLDRMGGELGLMSCWQAKNPGRRLAQTLRWVNAPDIAYHCDGIFIPRTWQARLTACRVVSGARWRQLSDHNPVVAELTPP